MTPKGSRKRVRPSPSGAESLSPTSPNNSVPDRLESKSHDRRTSWYPGSWSPISKAAPVTEVAHESIEVAQHGVSIVAESTTSLLDTTKLFRNPSLRLTKIAAASTRSLPANATTTRLNIESEGSASTTALDNLESSATHTLAHQGTTRKPFEKSANSQEPVPDAHQESFTSHSGHTATPEQSSGWFSWFYRSGTAEKSELDIPVSLEAPNGTNDKAIKDQSSLHASANNPDQQEPRDQEQESAETEIATASVPMAQKRSWMQMWYGSGPSTKPEEAPTEAITTNLPESVPSGTDSIDTTQNEVLGDSNAAGISQAPVGNTRSGWSFWSKDASKEAAPTTSQDTAALEATIDPATQPRQKGIESDPETNGNLTKKGNIQVKSVKDKRIKDGVLSSVEVTAASALPAEPRPADPSASKQPLKILPNQVLPNFEDTYHIEEPPSLFQSLGRYLQHNKSSGYIHVSRIKDPPRIKRALAIGVHGYFPAPLIRSVLGQPTGTSIRFSNMAAESIQRWTSNHGYSCEIEKIALEGEGRITERVDLLWKLLLSWMEEIRQADFILVACHSQGVPVSIMLVAKLIAMGCVNAARVGVCAMAGVNMGPFSSYQSRWISGSAGELFDFELPFSRVSKDYEAALKCALDFGVRISYVGSIDDQLVSLESSLFTPIAHPYIFRAAFVDGRVHAPSFLSHLVGFALKLRNLGIPDHGLIRELSTPLAGSLYSGEGHSRLYDEKAVYYMAVQFALETSTVPDPILNIKRSSSTVPPNPYILPFAMRGLLEEDHVRRELHDEMMELLRQFDDWKPSSKVLKDVKFRLEGIRSKL
ncbi:hypothetical protein N7495_005204 [Penicillium taxi]|uniref:uncharacterized protein n=1 Tax=Penicillium taxi TaxID=168475 RepID=UPI0025459250|nr:uncharacterized protein N7495_005204 [Penicillium taxi]KAJ5893513.1 hypothetical protein N7495_005204 [Penicillium taxi]